MKSNPIFKEVEEFIEQLRGLRNVEMRPDPNSQPQMVAAGDVADCIQDYEETTRAFRKRLTELRESKKEIKEQWEDAEDAYETIEFFTEVTEFFGHADLRKLLEARYNAAVELRDSITTAQAYGIIRPADGLLQKLEECQEDKRKLSRLILEYKEKLKLP